jgi:hypothetical protein
MKVTESCHCGAIAYEAEVDPNSVRVCHCTDCQRLTGTAFRAGIASLPGTFVLKRGTPKIYIKTAESGTKRAHGWSLTNKAQFAGSLTSSLSFATILGFLSRVMSMIFG